MLTKKLENLLFLLNKYYIYLFGFFVCIIGFNDTLSFCVSILFLIVLVFIDFDKFILFYLYLDIFSNVFSESNVYNLILRTYQFVFLIKFFLKIIKNGSNLSFEMFFKSCKRYWMIPLLFISLIMYERDVLTILSFLFFHAPILYMFCRKIRDKNFKSNLLEFIAISGVFVILWGLSHNLYGIGYMGSSSMTIRMSYISENPNGSGYILLLSTIASFYFITEKKYLILSVILSFGVLSTVSISAIIILIMFILFFLVKNHYIKFRYIFLLLALSIVLIFLIEIPIFVYIKNRILEIILPFISPKYAANTSSGMERVRIYVVYLENFFKLPLVNILFGGLDITKGPLLNYFIDNYNVLNSHCFLIDLLYGNGVIFLSILLGGIFFNLKKDFKYSKDNILFCLKITIILIASVTKVYPSILFYLLIVI